MSADLIFEDPPAVPRSGRPGGVSGLGLWLAALRDHPGVWAKYPERRWPSDATHIKTGRRYGVAPGEFDATVRDSAGGTRRCDLYVRYLGGDR